MTPRPRDAAVPAADLRNHLPAVPAVPGAPALACAGTADASPPARVPAMIAAGTANTAVFRRVRLRFAVSKPRTPGMLVSGKRYASCKEPVCSRGTPAVASVSGAASRTARCHSAAESAGGRRAVHRTAAARTPA